MSVNPTVGQILDPTKCEGSQPDSEKDERTSGRTRHSLIEDDFGEQFVRLKGSVTPDLDLEF